ncbi:ABC transporter permease [Chelatococcus sp. GCM10030263]|uniref:ABC transporter permease n=1 Tax=Chelatococcus sp. GCM10030263 TaxID=3273387 RepID=UPI00360B2C4A
MNAGPNAATEEVGNEIRATLAGPWTAPFAALVEDEAKSLLEAADGAGRVIIDISRVERLDTLGAWVLDRTRQELGEKGLKADFVGARPEQSILLNEIAYRRGVDPEHRRPSRSIDLLVEVGHGVVSAGKDMVRGVSFLGETVAGFIRVLGSPRRFRIPAVIHQLEQVAFRGVPIIVLISFLVGCIIAQQGIFQLQRFGAVTFVVDLVGILILRELAVLLTSIMVAGRSGSAFTAEIGSMKMREEVDALRVMGLDPIEVLIIPRVLALIIGLPLLTFISALSALLGGGIVAWLYGGVGPEIFLARLQAAIDLNTFLVGMIKAPFMAAVIGLIASLEGLAVEGSAESLGRQVTAAVVKSIFMVIVVDGLFAMFFAAIRF